MTTTFQIRVDEKLKKDFFDEMMNDKQIVTKLEKISNKLNKNNQ